MAEERKIRFIREEPWIAMTLRQYYFKLLPRELHAWFWDWVQDVGTVMRSRSTMVNMVATATYYILLSVALELFPTLKTFTIVKKVTGLLGGRP